MTRRAALPPIRPGYILITLALIAAVGMVTLRRQPPVSWSGRRGAQQRISVTLFEASGTPRSWSNRPFAESLAARLRDIPGIEARVGEPTPDADYILSGNVRADSGQVAVALRLRPADERVVKWAATFWRRDLTEASLSADLAGAVAQAIGVPVTPIKRQEPLP